VSDTAHPHTNGQTCTNRSRKYVALAIVIKYLLKMILCWN